MQDIGETFYMIAIEIFYDILQELLGLSQKAYIEKILEWFNMANCFTRIVLI